MVDSTSPTRFALWAGLFEALLALVAIVAGPWLGVPVTTALTEPITMAVNGGHPLTALGTFVVSALVATLPMVVGLVWVVYSRQPALQALRQLVQHRIAPYLQSVPWPYLVLLGISAGFGEEVLFRGLLQPAIGRAIPAWPGLDVGLVAVLFGLLHWVTRSYGLLATLAGAYLGCLYQISDNLWLPICVHAVYDVIALLWLVGRPPEASQPRNENGPLRPE